jgi:hypothetical protein
MPKRRNLTQPHRATTQKSRLAELEAEIQHLRIVVKSQAEMIAELQCRVDPYSQDGDSLCNSFYYQKGLYLIDNTFFS